MQLSCLTVSLMTALWVEIHSIFWSLWLATPSYIFTSLSDFKAYKVMLLWSSWKSVSANRLQNLPFCAVEDMTLVLTKEISLGNKCIMVPVCVTWWFLLKLLLHAITYYIIFRCITLVLLLSWFYRKACNPIASDQIKDLSFGVRMRE